MIEVRDLAKRYGPVEAVKGVSFTVGEGQVLGFLGPNGAGKSTIMKILTGCRFPSSGEALVDGISVQDNPVEVKRRTGYLPENVPLYGELSVLEYLGFIAQARGIPGEGRRRAMERSVALCGLGRVRAQRIDTLSRGFRQRVGLAQAIMHDPRVLILDEPCSGLDPNQIIEIRSLIRELGRRKTVILSTHILQEVEAVCSEVLILSEGRIAAQGKPGEIAGTMQAEAASQGSREAWELVLKGAGAAVVEKLLGELPGVSGLRVGAGHEGVEAVFCLDKAGGSGDAIFDWAVSKGLKLLKMNRKDISLEDMFVKLTTGQISLKAGAERRPPP
ncbi:MAG: ATP-binding cassette domain-containing protein [Treponema sp.]|nr:ATP-binding cassette domain-containing protein [Treponema sp.]